MNKIDMYINFLRDHYPFDSIPDDILHDLASSLQVHHYGTGQTIYRKGEECGIFYIIHTGIVYELIMDKIGEETIVATLNPGECFGAISILSGEHHSVTTRVKEDVELYVIYKADIDNLISRHPLLNKYLTRILTKKIRNLFLFFESERIKVFEKVKSAEEKEREIAFLNRITGLMGSKEGYERLIDTIVKEVSEYTDADICSIYLVDPITNELILEAAKGVNQDMLRKVKMYISQGITGWVIRNKEPVSVYDIHNDPRVHFISDIQEERLKSLLSLPLVVREKCIGVLNLASMEYRQYSYNDITSMGIIANHIALTIANFRLRKRVFATKEPVRSKIGRLDRFVGETSYVKNINRFIEASANTDRHILLNGEEGTGKNLISVLIHKKSKRYRGPYITVDCESFKNDSWGEELFGSEGDSPEKIQFGFFELAHGGTILLRNIDALNQINQVNLYKFLNEDRFVRINGHDTIYSNVRVIATVDGDIKKDTDEGRFNKDIHKLLSDNSFFMVPLRKRRKDIPVLCDHLLRKINNELHKDVYEISESAMERFLTYDWPGNVLELENVLRRAVILAKEGTILSDQIFFGVPRVEKRWEFNLFSLEPVKRFFYTTRLQKTIQGIAIIGMFFVIYSLIAGNSKPDNLTNIILWSAGWFGLYISSFTIGRIWCAICPFSSLADLFKDINSKKIPLPHDMSRKSEKYLAGLILLVLWIEGITVMPHYPLFTGLLIIFILSGAVIFSILYERRVWCRYLCPLGGLIGIYSLASFVTIRANRKLCLSRCLTHDCYLGREGMEGCPMFLHPYGIENSQNCTLCGACIRICRHNSLHLPLHLPTTGIEDIDIFSLPFSFLVSALTGILLVENGSLLSMRSHLFIHLNSIAKINPNIFYTLLFLLAMTLPAILIIIMELLINRVSKDGIKAYFTNLSYSFIPLALMGHIALYGEALIKKIPEIVNLTMKLIGSNIRFSAIGLRGEALIEIIQVLITVFGGTGSVYLLLRIYKKLQSKNLPRRKTIPVYLSMILFFTVIYIITFLII
ncbi:MAG: sigma 54-interacting transcriptional regulator [Nitrospirota bacterium]